MTPERYQQIKQLFQGAVERDAGQRASFLEQACAGDAQLRAEVERLLAHDAQGSPFLERPAILAGEGERRSDAPSSVVGRRIGPYKILREIGRGGMGTVYLAERADEAYRKQVAIKLVKRGMDSDGILRRFRNERQILADLDHPHIARLLDGGTTEDGLSYFVMDYVEGRPIDVYCDNEKLATAGRLKIFLGLCSAVHYAHQRRVVHRDLKPSNILVTAEGIPKLLDFGIAKVLSPGSFDQSGVPTGVPRPMTPVYASPEQVRGDVITPASDVYSLGVLLYELLTGHRPYHFRIGTLRELERFICGEEPRLPSATINRVEEVPGTNGAPPVTLTPASVSETRDGQPERLRRRLLGDLDTIILKALRKEPERRYASVEAFSEDVRRHLEGLPIVARKDAVLYRAAKFIKRNKFGVVAAGLIAVLLTAAIAGGFYLFAGHGKVISSIAVLPLENLSGDPTQEYFADGMTEALITDLAQIGALRVISRTSAMQFKGVRKPLPEIARQLRVDAVVEGSVLRSGDQVRITAQLIHAATEKHLWARTYERDLRDVPALQSEVAQAIAKELRINPSRQERARIASSGRVGRGAYEAYLKGRYFWSKRSPEDLKRAQEFFQQAIEEDPRYARAYAGLADYYVALSFDSPVPPRQAFPKAKEAATKALEIDDTLAEAHVSLANTLTFYEWNWPSAEREFKRALELNPNYAIGHRFYATFLGGMGRHQEAIAEAKRAQELDPLAPVITEMVGRCYFHSRQFDQAIEQDRKALEIDPTFRLAHFFLGHAYAAKGMYTEALAEAKEVRHPTEANPIAGLPLIGYLYAKIGRTDEAQQVLEKLISISKQRYVPSFHMMELSFALGKKDEGFAWLEKAIEEREGRLLWFNETPMLDNVRSDPRFAEVVRRLRLPDSDGAQRPK